MCIRSFSFRIFKVLVEVFLKYLFISLPREVESLLAKVFFKYLFVSLPRDAESLIVKVFFKYLFIRYREKSKVFF